MVITSEQLELRINKMFNEVNEKLKSESLDNMTKYEEYDLK